MRGPVADPDSPYYAAVPAVSNACTATTKTVKNTTATLAPGVLSGGIDISTLGVANLQKGVCVIKNGDLRVDS